MTKTFTLIELLVVLAILAILAALLLPVLGRARFQALKTAEMSNMRQVALGLLYYADDHNATLPPSDYGVATNELPPSHVVLRDWANWDYVDHRPVADEYGFMPATANPVTGAVAWDHPNNTAQAHPNGDLLRQTRTYLATHRYELADAVEKRYLAVNKVIAADAGSNLLSHFLVWLGPYGYQYVGTYVREAVAYHPYPDVNTSYRCRNGATPEGVQILRYDGSADWVDFEQMGYFTHPTGSRIYYPKQP